MSMPAPPGLLSPAAFPFAPPFPQNDAPAPGVPYLIGTKVGPASASLALTLNTGSNAGDTIVVFTASAGTVAVSCTDTRGNSYSLTVPSAGSSERINQFTAVNPAPLRPGDSVTVTWVTTGVGFTVIGMPGAGAATPGGNLIPDAVAIASGSGTTTMTGTIAASSLNSPAEVAVAYVVTGSAAGPVNWPTDWTVITSGSIPAGSGYGTSAACKVLTSKAQVRATFLSAVTNPLSGLIICTFMPETRFAPRRPPDMPPGMQSPGAWQYAPLMAPEGPWSTRYNPGPNKWAETLPAVPVTRPALTRSTSKTLAAAPVSHGALARTVARFRILATSPHAAAALAKGTGKRLAATAHPAGKLARGTGKALAAKATAHTASALSRSYARVLAVTVRAAARLSISAPAPVFTLGVPQLEWNVSISTIGLSQLSLEYVPVPVAATRSGVSYNPTGDAVTFAFIPTPTQVPGSGDWIAGSWETVPGSLLYPYNARCLVGPAGNVTLGVGTYIMYIHITDNPTVPVKVAGQLQIF
jgi:hypothetical protein